MNAAVFQCEDAVQEDRADDGGRGSGFVHQITRDLPQPADPTGTGGSTQDLR